MRIKTEIFQNNFYKCLYTCLNEEQLEAFMIVSFENYRHLDETANWSMIPKIEKLDGSLEGKQELLSYLFKYAKSPILAAVKSYEEEFFGNYGFHLIYRPYWVREKKGVIKDDSHHHEKTNDIQL